MSTSALKASVLLVAFVLGTGSDSSAQSVEVGTSSATSTTSAQSRADRELGRSARRVTSARSDIVFVTREERTLGIDVHQFLTRKHPAWLRPRGASLNHAARAVQAVVNGTPWGDASMLRDLPMSSVRRIQRLSAADASTQYGIGYTQGAILVTTI